MALIIITASLLLNAASLAWSSEGHNAALSVAEFQIDTAEVILNIEPETFIKGKIPVISAVLTNYMSGSPVLDAEIYIYMEHADEMSGRENRMEHVMPSPANTEAEGLDFGGMTGMPESVDMSSFKKLQPQQMAGVYAAEYPLIEKGDYKFMLAVKSLGGKTFTEPVIYGGAMQYNEASKASLYRMLSVVGFIIISGLTAVWIVSQRKTAGLNPGQKLDLLDIPWVRRFLRSAWYQPVFQVPVLVFFLLIIFAGLFDIQQGDRNIATLLMWTIWWAAIIFTFVLAGRIWCMMCCYGALQDWIQRIFSFMKDFPKPLRNIWLPSFLFFGLTVWDSFSGIVNKPALTAYLLMGFFIAAAAMAVIFKGRAFCRYVCPIGGLIGIYSMFSPLELRNKCMDVCRKHKVKDCIKGTEKSSPCPMFVTPMTLDRNNYCNLCSECIKSCSQDNIVVRFRGFAKDLWVSAKGYTDEAYLAIALVGVTIIVTGEMIGPWHGWMDVVGRAIPYAGLGITSHAQIEKITFIIVLTIGSLIIPLSLLAAASFITRKLTGAGSPLSFKNTIVQFAYMLIPVGISMHLAHNISHLFKEGPGIVPAFQRFINTYTGLNTGEPDWNVTPLMSDEPIFWLQMLVLVILNIFSLYAGYRIAVKYYGDKALRAFIPMAVLVTLFMAINTFILGQPMALRHTH